MSHNLANGTVVVGSADELDSATVGGVILAPLTASEVYLVAARFAMPNGGQLVHGVEVTMTDAVDVTV